MRLRQPRIQGPPPSAGGTPAACAAEESALPSVHPARSPPPRSPSVPPPPHAARRGDLEGLPIGVKPRPYGLCVDSAGPLLAGPYRAPVAPRSALPGFTRTMAPVRYGKQARQANTTELTSRRPRTASRMDRAGCAVSCGLPWYSRGVQNCCSVCSARKPPARCWSREQRLQAHGARKTVRMRVTGAHIKWRALQMRLPLV